MRVLIISQHTNNFGDDSAGVGLVNRMLSIENVEHIDILYRYANEGVLPIKDKKVSHYNERVPQYLYKNKLRWFFDLYYYIKLYLLGIDNNKILLDLIRTNDVIYVSPCGADLGSYRDRVLLYTLLTCVKNKKKIIFHLNSFDDSKQCSFRWLSNIVFQNSNVFTREMGSYNYLKTQKINSVFGIDSAFMLAYSHSNPYESNYITLIISQINKWHGKYLKYQWNNEDYLRYVVEPVLQFAQKHNKKVWLLPHTDMERNFLLNMFALINERYPETCIFRSDVDDMYKYSLAISDSYMVISCRYHGVVLAAHNAIPYVGIAYDTKTNEVCDYTGGSKYCIEYTDVMNSDNPLLGKIETLQKEYSNFRNRLLAFRNSEIKNTVFMPTECLNDYE